MKHVSSGSKEAAAEEMINVMWSDVREASSSDTFLLLHITCIYFFEYWEKAADVRASDEKMIWF